MGHLTLMGGDLNAHSPLWDNHQSGDTRGEQLEEWVIAHSVSALKDGPVTLLDRAAGDLINQYNGVDLFYLTE